MNLSYATFAFLPGEIQQVSTSRELVMSPRNTTFTERRSLQFRGMIVANGQAAIQTRAAAITAGLALNGAGDVGLLKDDAGATEIYLPNASSFTGVRVTRRPSFNCDGSKAHFVTGLPFAGEFVAEYLVDITADRYFDFTETITLNGRGNGIRVVRPVDYGDWVEQPVTSTTPRIVIQEGQSVGRTDWPKIGGNPALEPVAPAPIFPDRILNELQDYEISEITPQRNGSLYFGCGMSWRYVMTLLDSSAVVPHPTYV